LKFGLQVSIRERLRFDYTAYQKNIKNQVKTFAKRHFSKSALICPISASGSNFGTLVKLQRYPRNILYIPVVDPPEVDRLP